jgi:hypothetical protein
MYQTGDEGLQKRFVISVVNLFKTAHQKIFGCMLMDDQMQNPAAGSRPQEKRFIINSDGR